VYGPLGFAQRRYDVALVETLSENANVRAKWQSVYLAQMVLPQNVREVAPRITPVAEVERERYQLR